MRPTATRASRIVPDELLPLLSALATALVVEVGLRVTTLPRLGRLLGTPLLLEDASPVLFREATTFVLTEDARRQIRATRRLLRHWPFGDTCLRQALISGHRLRHLQPVLQVGVARHDGAVRAHAWLVVGGVVIDPLFAAASYEPLGAVPEGLRA